LADVNKWPELTMPASPHLSEDDSARASGFPGASLKYTQTIMGSKSGGVGLRVSGSRRSSALEPESLVNVSPTTEKTGNSTNSVQPQVMGQEQDVNVAETSSKVVQFIPQFRGATGLEARRRIRASVRRTSGRTGASQKQLPTVIDPELSSSSSSAGAMDDDDDDDDNNNNNADDEEFDEMIGDNDSADDDFDL
jgi:hypothetical protein